MPRDSRAEPSPPAAAATGNSFLDGKIGSTEAAWLGGALSLSERVRATAKERPKKGDFVWLLQESTSLPVQQKKCLLLQQKILKLRSGPSVQKRQLKRAR